MQGNVFNRLIWLFCAGVAVVALRCAHAEGPAWWTEREVLVPGATPNDHAPVNMGQLKWFAAKAAEELRERLPSGAGTGIQPLLDNWLPDGVNYAPVNVGQLKFLASVFYDRLIEVGYTDKYPWADPPSVNNYVAANIGQVKNLFSFDLTKNTDQDQLPDWWEIHYFGNITDQGTDGDPDGDDLRNLAEYLRGTDPATANYFPGDINGDAEVTDADISGLGLMIAPSGVAYPISSVIRFARADMNSDGRLDADDYEILADILNGKPMLYVLQPKQSRTL